MEPLVIPEAQQQQHQQHHNAPPEFYGTRLSTVLLVRRDGSVLFIERDIWTLDSEGNVMRGEASRDRVFRFRIQTE